MTFFAFKTVQKISDFLAIEHCCLVICCCRLSIFFI